MDGWMNGWMDDPMYSCLYVWVCMCVYKYIRTCNKTIN